MLHTNMAIFNKSFLSMSINSTSYRNYYFLLTIAYFLVILNE